MPYSFLLSVINGRRGIFSSPRLGIRVLNDRSREPHPAGMGTKHLFRTHYKVTVAIPLQAQGEKLLNFD